MKMKYAIKYNENTGEKKKKKQDFSNVVVFRFSKYRRYKRILFYIIFFLLQPRSISIENVSCIKGRWKLYQRFKGDGIALLLEIFHELFHSSALKWKRVIFVIFGLHFIQSAGAPPNTFEISFFFLLFFCII